MEIVILDKTELLVLWAIALFVPPVAHLFAHTLGGWVGVQPRRPLLRIFLLTGASISTLLWITGSRFASVQIEPEEEREERFVKQLTGYLGEDPTLHKRLIFVASSLFEYGYHLRRLEKLLDQVRERERPQRTPESEL